MAVYFIIENEDLINQRIKIGYSKDPSKRIRALQTGNSRKLALMGWIECANGKSYEKKLHNKYEQFKILNEWYEIDSDIVLGELKENCSNGYIALQSNIGEFLGYASQGGEEYMDLWEWGNVEIGDFCPMCGCSCGLSYNENYSGERCLKCGVIDNNT